MAKAKKVAAHKIKQAVTGVKAVKGAKKAAKSKVSNIKEHIEKLSDDRRDCASIWTLIKHDSSIYKTDDDIKNLIKSKGYETLLGEIS